MDDKLKLIKEDGYGHRETWEKGYHWLNCLANNDKYISGGKLVEYVTKDEHK